MKRKYLNGLWEFNINGEKDKCSVQIPGSVLSGYLENGKIEDPYFGTNEYKARDMFWNEFEFHKSFEIDATFLDETEIFLVCNGIDTLGDIYINGKFVKATNNMHQFYSKNTFDV